MNDYKNDYNRYYKRCSDRPPASGSAWVGFLYIVASIIILVTTVLLSLSEAGVNIFGG